jgi:hypothetical protein
MQRVQFLLTLLAGESWGDVWPLYTAWQAVTYMGLVC